MSLLKSTHLRIYAYAVAVTLCQLPHLSANADTVQLDLSSTATVARVYGPGAASLLGSGECRGMAYGDINGDGYADLVLGAPQDSLSGRPSCGSVLVVYGNSLATSNSVDLASTASQPALGTTRIYGPTSLAKAGYSVAAGDLDNDGYDDICIGAPYALTASTTGSQVNSGAAFVVWGSAGQPGKVIDLASAEDAITSAAETRIIATQSNGQVGWSVSAGDINADGRADLAIGAPSVTMSSAKPSAGLTYIIRGNTSLRGQKIVLGSQTPSTAGESLIVGSTSGESCGYSLATGDINGDGFGDLAIGAANADLSGGRDSAGRAWIVYGGIANIGTTSGTGTVLDLASAGTTVTKLLGNLTGDRLGTSLACGDVNGDGRQDVVVGSPALPGANSTSAYVVYGSGSLPTSTLDFSSTAGTYGETRVIRGSSYEGAGASVSAGDINGDGADDLLVGAPQASPGTPERAEAGKLYIFYGSNTVSKLGLVNGAGSTLYLDPNSTGTDSVELPPVDTSIPYDFYSDTLSLYTGANRVVDGLSTFTVDAAKVAVLRGRVLQANGDPYPGVDVSVTTWTTGASRIEFEDFTGGASPVEGVDYLDNSDSNIGGNNYRNSQVDIDDAQTGYIVGWTANGEWLRYRWYGGGDAPSGWLITTSYASAVGQQTCKFEIDATTTVTLTMPGTSAWDVFKRATVWVPASAFSTETTHTIRMITTSGGTGTAGGPNYDYFEIEPLGRPTTQTAADGTYNLVVNAPKKADITFKRTGSITAVRTVDPVIERAFNAVPDVELVDYDSSSTTLTFGAGTTTYQPATQTPVSDTSGTRQAAMLIPPGTTAQLVTPNGTVNVTTLTLRITELTVGENGDDRMPAPLPEGTAYTYCVDIDADEARAAGATTVQFNQPVPYYVDNFLGFPVGATVPGGYYDEVQKQWLPYSDGLVVSLVGISGGSAQLDLDGNGTADNSSTTMSQAQGITNAERVAIANLYASKSMPYTFWRIPLSHLCIIDLNWGWAMPSWMKAPLAGLIDAFSPPDDPCDKQVGGALRIQEQLFLESMPITGSPYTLRYSSGRVPGNLSKNRVGVSFIPNPEGPSGSNADFLGAVFEVKYMGRNVSQFFPTDENVIGKPVTHFWEPDGIDAYKRFVPGFHNVSASVGYRYAANYNVTLPTAGSPAMTFASGMVEIPSATRADTVIVKGRRIITLWKDMSSVARNMGRIDARGIGLGGWDIDCHHAYNPMTKTLYLGDGRERSGVDLGPLLKLTIGGASNEGSVPLSGFLNGVDPTGIAKAADGVTWLAYFYSGAGYIVRIDPFGATKTFNVGSTRGLAAGPDGAVYFAQYNGTGTHWVKRIDPKTYTITVVAGGGGNAAFQQMPATQAALNGVGPLAMGPDGSLYIGEGITLAKTSGRIRRLAPNGVLYPFAGSGNSGAAFNGEDIPATSANLSQIEGLAVGPDRSVYVSQKHHFRVRKISPFGIINTLAGSGNSSGPLGDYTTATAATVLSPAHLAVSPAGLVYIGDDQLLTVRVVRPDGTIITQAGGGTDTVANTAFATGMKFSDIFDLKMDNDGELLLGTKSSGGMTAVRKMAVSMPGVSITDFIIASEDGSEVHKFSPSGRHLATLHGLTGAPLATFGYDSAGRLASITDGYNNKTVVAHDPNGNPTEITAPFGQKTMLGVQGQGFLSDVTNPANETTHFEYSPGGLLKKKFMPMGQMEEIQYEADGRVKKTIDAAGGTWNLERNEITPSRIKTTIYNSNSPNHKETHTTERYTDGGYKRTSQNCCGGGLESIERLANGKVTRTLADQTVLTGLLAPDPRFGMQAPYAKSLIVRTPAGRTSMAFTTPTLTLTSAGNLFSVALAKNDVEVNGSIMKSTYFGGSRQEVVVTPQGRVSTATIDALGTPLGVQVSGLEPVDANYDSHGLPTELTAGSGSDLKRLQFRYNAVGYLTSTTDTLGQVTSYTTDKAGRDIEANHPGNRNVSIQYNRNSWLTALTPPGKPAHQFSYTEVGDMNSYIPPSLPAAGSTTADYDPERRPETIQRPDGSAISFSYGPSTGRLDSVTASDHSYGLTYYASTGNLTQILKRNATGDQESTASFTYDGSLPLTASHTGVVTGTLAVQYDSKLRLASRSINSTATVAYTYNPDNLLTKVGDLALTRSLSTGFTTGTELGQIKDMSSFAVDGTRQRYSATGASVANLLDVEYGHDLGGRIVQTTETVLVDPAKIYQYQYDHAGRLHKVSVNGALAASYAFDDNGNRTGVYMASEGTTTSAFYDAQDRLILYGTKHYGYTPNGELTVTTEALTSAVTRYFWNGTGSLKQVDLPDGTIVEYQYNALGQRAVRKVDGTVTHRWLWEGSLRPAAEIDGSGAIIDRCVYGEQINVPDYIVRAGVKYRLITDHLGSVRLVVDSSSGLVVQQMDYDEWGRVTNDTNPGFQPFGYAGGFYDTATGLAQFGARWYDAEAGRWVSKDPIGFRSGDTNFYAYTYADPINYIDPNGLAIWKKIWRIYDRRGELVGTVKGKNKGHAIPAIKGHLGKAGPGAVVQAPDAKLRSKLATSLSPDGKMRGPEQRDPWPEHVHPNKGPYSKTHIQNEPPVSIVIASILIPASMGIVSEAEAGGDPSVAEFAGAAVWDIFSTLDPFFITDFIDWLMENDC